MKRALAFLTKDKVELSKRTIEPILKYRDQFDLFWIDGSDTEEGRKLPYDTSVANSPHRHIFVHPQVKGGPDAAIVYALSTMLKGEYQHVGLIESDVLLQSDWFPRTMQLFERGEADGLVVGVSSARCYADRILCQRDGYAVMHNLGAGMAIFHHEAAALVLNHFRTNWSSHNRAVFAQLAGLDIGRFWAFKGAEHWLCSDWGFDRVLASNGYASVALTPSPVEMIGQTPPLADQGLIIVDKEIHEFRNTLRFSDYTARLRACRGGRCSPLGNHVLHHEYGQGYVIFPHQVGGLNGRYEGKWKLKWFQGFGPFAWQAREAGASLVIELFGPVTLFLSGGDEGGTFRIEDQTSKYEAKPYVPAGQLLSAAVPAGMSYRTIRLTALVPDVIFQGIQTTFEQPWNPSWQFDHSILPEV